MNNIPANDTPDLDPRWEWISTRRLCDPGPTYERGRCNHLEVVPVTQAELLGGATVAHLCLTCDEQLPAEWQPTPLRLLGRSVAEYARGGVVR